MLKVRLFAVAESLEILFSLLTAAMGQTIARKRVRRLGGMLGHFLFDALCHVALDVRTFDEAAECGGAAPIILVHLGVARIRGAAILRATADATALSAGIATGLTVRIHQLVLTH